ncbi:hypothetical protein LTR85_006408 [Meristemomyces frigidus]|nr:hypothetical protein LTR85_006408 [Meristemomyces frigidus]
MPVCGAAGLNQMERIGTLIESEHRKFKMDYDTGKSPIPKIDDPDACVQAKRIFAFWSFGLLEQRRTYLVTANAFQERYKSVCAGPKPEETPEIMQFYTGLTIRWRAAEDVMFGHMEDAFTRIKEFEDAVAEAESLMVKECGVSSANSGIEHSEL